MFFLATIGLCSTVSISSSISDIKTKNPPRWQVAAHHAYFGGRIEMMKQGYLAKGELHIYDVASAYPSAMVELPSMRNGKWRHEKALSPS
jgi:DNA polymerase type B, organellar and viral